MVLQPLSCIYRILTTIKIDWMQLVIALDNQVQMVLQLLSCIYRILTTIKIEMQLVIALDNQVQMVFVSNKS